MKKLLVCTLAIAMLLGFGIGTSQAQTSRSGAYIDDGGIGDLLLFSLYDVRVNQEDKVERSGTWENFIAIENTSGAWTAFHLRFRAWKKSIEVFDHVVLLSPFDVFWMILRKAPGGVEMYSADTETLRNSGLIFAPEENWQDFFSPELLQKSGFCLGDNQQACLENEMRTGYMEAIGMFQLEIPNGVCGLSDDEACTEDTHDITDIVSDVNKYTGGPGAAGAINAYDVLDALFFAYYPTNWDNFTADDEYFIATVGGNEVWAAWPYYNEVSIGYCQKDPTTGSCTATQGDLPIYQYIERGLDYKERAGLDCGNVLTGVFFMADDETGRFQMENFIALRNFRTQQRGPEANLPFYSWNHADPDGLCDGELGAAIVPGGAGINGVINAGDCITYANDGQAYWWNHRDGYQGGIFYPAAKLNWFYGVQTSSSPATGFKFAGGTEDTFLWYYIYPNVATVAGPTLMDGDNLAGRNWNDLYTQVSQWTAGGYLIPSSNIPLDFYGFTAPINSWGPAGSIRDPLHPGAFVHYFNDIWSLDDVELAIQKADIWSTHWTTVQGETGADGIVAGQTTTTDVILTYPTKHNHWFFADWPFMWKFAQAKTDGIDSDDWNQYIANVYNYLGDFEPALNQPGWGYVGKKSIEALTAPDLNTLNKFNTGNWSYAEWFQDHSSLQNGRLYADALIWDMNQVLCGTPYNGNPPPSPWAPETTDFPIPHEVNVIRVGYSYGLSGSDIDHTKVGLGEANPLLECAGKEVGGVHPWRKGHFRLSQSLLKVGQRSIWMDLELLDDAENISVGLDAQGKKGFHSKWTSIYASSGNGYYYLPPIGLVVQGNEKADADAGTFSVSNKAGMAEWHYMELKQDYKDGIGR
jgi:hypothetical protein